jgi:ketosteroid isomerase-like protein
MSQQTSGQRWERQRWEQEVLAADGDFFTALVEGDEQALDSVLADDFVLVGVNDGAVVPRAALLPLVGQGQLQFDAIEPDRSEVLVRRYGTTTIVVGRTEMRGSYDGAPFSARSRYTHVFVEDQGRWRLASAQGTPIVGD